jgi:hypothetical protein
VNRARGGLVARVVLDVLIVQIVLVVLHGTTVYAQSFEVGGGFTLAGGYDAGSAGANETRNPSTGSTPLTLFQTSSRVLAATGVDVYAGVYVTRRLLVSARFQYSRPTLRTHLSGDFEGAADTDADTTVSSYLFGGVVEYQFAAGRWTPFVSGGAGQLRDVPDGGDVLTAAEIHAGGGVRRALTHGPHPFGVRGEVVATYRSRGAGFDINHHVVPSASAGLTWRF